jgi:hypothetical protein
MENRRMSFSSEVEKAIVEYLEGGRISLREAAARGRSTESRVKL